MEQDSILSLRHIIFEQKAAVVRHHQTFKIILVARVAGDNEKLKYDYCAVSI